MRGLGTRGNPDVCVASWRSVILRTAEPKLVAERFGKRRIQADDSFLAKDLQK